MHGDPAPLDTDFEVLASSPRRFSRRVQIVLLAVVVLVAGIVGVRWLTDRHQPVRITAYGQPVADPQGVLDDAQHTFEVYTAARNGALGPGARCWFQRQSGTSDIAGTLLCGPVLFYDDDPTAPYLRFPLIAHGTGSPVRLEAESRPASAEPSAASDGTTLVRPSGTSQPVHSAGISAPVPPPAPPDTLGPIDTVHPDNLVPASESSVIGADLITVRLASFGQVGEFGSGIAERSAPAGMLLYAFRIVFGGGENGFALLPSLDLGVSVNGAPPRRLPLAGVEATGSGQLFVVAAQPSASLDLVLTEYGITQRMSLRDGTPDPGNILFLQSPHGINVPRTGLFVPAAVTVAGHHPERTQLLVSIDGVEREFFLPGSAMHPARHDHVFLLLSVEYVMQSIPGAFGFATPDIMTLTPEGGTPIHGRVVHGIATPLYDVPVDMTDATITLAGPDLDLGDGLSLTGPVSFPLHMVPTDG